MRQWKGRRYEMPRALSQAPDAWAEPCNRPTRPPRSTLCLSLWRTLAGCFQPFSVVVATICKDCAYLHRGASPCCWVLPWQQVRDGFLQGCARARPKPYNCKWTLIYSQSSPSPSHDLALDNTWGNLCTTTRALGAYTTRHAANTTKQHNSTHRFSTHSLVLCSSPLHHAFYAGFLSHNNTTVKCSMSCSLFTLPCTRCLPHPTIAARNSWHIRSCVTHLMFCVTPSLSYASFYSAQPRSGLCWG